MATRLVCGNRMVEITMTTWTGNGYTPDWSNDFFNVGVLKYDEDLEAYEVEDIDYCIDQAEDWKNKEGDFYGEEDVEGIERVTTVDELDFPAITKDGEYIHEGMWISNSTGIYEVKSYTSEKVECREVVFDGDGDDYHLDDCRVFFTNYEIHHRFTYY